MRQVFVDSGEVARRSARALADIEREHSDAARSRFIVQRLDRIQSRMSAFRDLEAHRESEAAEHRARESAETERLLQELENLIAVGAQPDAPAFLGPVGRGLRSLMLRATRHARLHQIEVDRRIIEILQRWSATA